MKIDKEKCIGCERCHPYCPVGAITTVEWEAELVSEINQVECVECGTCHERSGICTVDAIYMPELKWPRSIREPFSNPNAKHPTNNSQGRGTEEMKTNDVTGQFVLGMAGVIIELGRPGIGTSFRDIQTVSMALAKLGAEFENNNPVANLMVDLDNGIFNEEVLDEKVLSAILVFKVSNDRLKKILLEIKKVAFLLDTVFSLSLVSRVDSDFSIPVIPIAQEAGFSPGPNNKTNVGLGKALLEEV